MEKKYSLVCQKCGSPELKIVETPWRIKATLFTERKCRRCGFEGTPIEASQTMKNALQKKFLEGKK